jgi:hypothetical protein
MSSYLNHLKAVASPRAEIARAANIIGAAGGGSSSLTKFLDDMRDSAPRDVEDGIPTLAGAVIGTFYGYRRKHWLLGAIGGASLGRNLPALVHAGDRTIALKNLGTTGFAVGCSLMSRKHPAIGFVVGDVLARAAIYFAERVRGT